ncbi:hypothetical protein phiOC_p322 [Ochrobactrum phage vB_OspM_OC]|nr:hypothetical protein phiOC_p322 [Ochrobactrum phage vB_OspM_OC]
MVDALTAILEMPDDSPEFQIFGYFVEEIHEETGTVVHDFLVHKPWTKKKSGISGFIFRVTTLYKKVENNG